MLIPMSAVIGNVVSLLKTITRVRRPDLLRPLSAAGCLSASPDVRASLHEDGVVFLQLRSGTVFRSNRMGAAIWKGVLDRQDVAAIASGLAAECSVPAELVTRDATEFLAQLEAKGILVRGAEG